MPPVTSIKVGQSFVDEPITVWPKPVPLMRLAVKQAVNPDRKPLRPIVTGYNRVKLNWVKPPDAVA